MALSQTAFNRHRKGGKRFGVTADGHVRVTDGAGMTPAQMEARAQGHRPATNRTLRNDVTM